MKLRGLLPFALAVAVVGGVVVVGGACVTPQRPYDYTREPDPRRQEFVLGPSDVLKITVWRNPELSGEAVVRPDGTISLPLIGDLRAAGRTPGQIRAEVVQRLATFVKDEDRFVTVGVVSVNSYRFILSGNVEKPGVYSANHYVTFTEAVALAGGPNKFANADESVILRPDPATGRTKRIPVDYLAILEGRRPDQDLCLLAGDTIWIP